ncbi:MAG TPA: hypothetical protein PLG22_07135 [Kiritimatiellia bacterium]|nr:hypothetical protein [Kiritimatiellia bacterium]
MHPLALLVIVLWLVCAAVFMVEAGTFRHIGQLWKEMGIPARALAVVLIVFFTQEAATKGTTPVRRVLSFLFWDPGRPWQLAGTRAVLDGAEEAVTSTALPDLAAGSNTLDQVSSLVETQEIWTISSGWPMSDRIPYHEEQNVMGENPWRSNVWINGELYHDHYVAFNSMVGTNPAILSIDYTARADDGSVSRWLCDVVSNSYPQASVITLEHGSYTCYWFRCKVPAAITNCVMDWDREVVFGAPQGSGRGFNIAGVFVVSKDGQLWQGRTYTNIVNGVTNVVINGIKVVTE